MVGPLLQRRFFLQNLNLNLVVGKASQASYQLFKEEAMNSPISVLDVGGKHKNRESPYNRENPRGAVMGAGHLIHMQEPSPGIESGSSEEKGKEETTLQFHNSTMSYKLLSHAQTLLP